VGKMGLRDLELLVRNAGSMPEQSPEVTRRGFLLTLAGALATAASGCALTLEPTKEELAFYERLKSMPKGKKPITDFPEIVAGVGKEFPHIIYDAEQHKPPIGIDYEVNTSFPWTPIVAPARGYVGFAEFNTLEGYNITIGHGGIGHHYTKYGHMQPNLLVNKGDIVERGTLLGFGGKTGSGAKNTYHYHIGAVEPTFDFSDEPRNWVMVVNPHRYAEKDRLGTWSGNDLDSKYESGIREAHQYSNNLIDKLPQDMLSNINKDRKYKIGKQTTLNIKLGFLHDLSEKEVLQKYVKENTEKIKENLERFMSLKPTYTLFVNPKRLDLYHVIIH